MDSNTVFQYRYIRAQELALDAVPDELKNQNRWIPWQQQAQSDPSKKPRKRPMDYRTGVFGSYTDEGMYLSFADANRYMVERNWDGLMFVLSPDLPYTGIDLDDCIDDDGRFYSQKLEVTLIQMDSYVEISPSGIGVKMLVKGKVKDLHRHSAEYQPSDSARKQSVEFYDNKPWTFTGLRLPSATDKINERTNVLNDLYLKVFGQRPIRNTQNDNDFPKDATLTEVERTIVKQEVVHALTSIDPHPYEDWRDIGFALKTFGRQIGDEEARRIWENWSRKADNFSEQDLDYQWERFSDDPDGVTIGTIFYLAQDNGYEFSRDYKDLLKVKIQKNDLRPRICLPYGETELRDTAGQLGALMGKSGQYYVRDGSLFALINKKGRELLRLVDRDMFRAAVEDVARLGSYRPPRKDEGDKPVWEPKRISPTDASAILKAKQFTEQIPEISIVVNCPVLVEKDGELKEICGYDSDSGIYSRGKPTETMSLTEAINFLNEIYIDYDFVTENDKSRALAGLLSPAITFGRLLGIKRSPLDLTEADHPQAGKGLRVNLIARIYSETPTPVVQRNGGVGSWDESFGNALLRGSPFIFIDNVRGKLSSQSLESFATERLVSVRPVGKQEISIDPTRYIVFIASNAAKGERDLAQRVSITSICKRPTDYHFKRYPEGDIEDHIASNQDKYLGAVHTIVKEWYRRGKPTKPVAIRNSFQRWFEVMEYILTEIMHEASVFQGVVESMERFGNPLLPWLRVLAIEIKRLGYLGKEMSTSDIISVVEDSDLEQGWVKHPYNLTDETERERAYRSLGGKMGRLFSGDGDEISVGIFSIKRIETKDDLGRARRKYVFTENLHNSPEHGGTPAPRSRTQNPIDIGSPEHSRTLSTLPSEKNKIPCVNTSVPVREVRGVREKYQTNGDQGREPLVFDPDWADDVPPAMTTTTTTKDWLGGKDEDFEKEEKIMGLD